MKGNEELIPMILITVYVKLIDGNVLSENTYCDYKIYRGDLLLAVKNFKEKHLEKLEKLEKYNIFIDQKKLFKIEY